MTQSTSTPVLPSTSTLRTATRWLAGAHAVFGVASLVAAVFLIIGFVTASEEENLAAVALFLGLAYLVVGGILLGLCVGTLRARQPGATYGFGLGAGLFALVVAGPAVTLFFSPLLLTPLVAAVSLALVVCSLVGLISRGRA